MQKYPCCTFFGFFGFFRLFALADKDLQNCKCEDFCSDILISQQMLIVIKEL